MQYPSRPLLSALALLCASSPAFAQGPAFQSPGVRGSAPMGQTTRFSNEFNPAIGVALDASFDYVDDETSDGFDATLRSLELNASAYVDPNAWAYFALVSERGESPEFEEAVVELLGLGGNRTLRAGRFFVDFGKEMQLHAEELRTLERALPLRLFLGEELGGYGLQYGDWFAAGDATPVRFSVGVFSSLLEEEHDDDEGEPRPEAVAPDRKSLGELAFTARLTGMTDVGETGLIQVGASARLNPEFSFRFEDAGLEVDGLSNAVYGVDLTYQRTDDTGIRKLVVGGEALYADGDLAGVLDDPVTPTSISVVDDEAAGFFVYGDYAWTRFDSAGVQFALADLLEDTSAEASELDVYYTRYLTEFRRLRIGVTLGDFDGEDVLTAYVQLTAFIGNHSHGLDW